jgi:hypothetical protein
VGPEEALSETSLGLPLEFPKAAGSTPQALRAAGLIIFFVLTSKFWRSLNSLPSLAFA